MLDFFPAFLLFCHSFWCPGLALPFSVFASRSSRSTTPTLVFMLLNPSKFFNLCFFIMNPIMSVRLLNLPITFPFFLSLSIFLNRLFFGAVFLVCLKEHVAAANFAVSSVRYRLLLFGAFVANKILVVLVVVAFALFLSAYHTFSFNCLFRFYFSRL